MANSDTGTLYGIPRRSRGSPSTNRLTRRRYVLGAIGLLIVCLVAAGRILLSQPQKSPPGTINQAANPPVAVPSIVGLDETDALTTIRAAGLIPSAGPVQTAATCTTGEISQQQPSPQQSVARGTSVIYALCGNHPSSTPAAPTTPPAHAPAHTHNTPGPTKPGSVFITANGYGPYYMGMSLATVRAENLVNETVGCSDIRGSGTGTYSNIALYFADDKLLWLSINNTGRETAAGAKIGMAFDTVYGKYGARANLLHSGGTSGQVDALSVRNGSNTLLLIFNQGHALTTIEAGSTTELEGDFTGYGPPDC